MDDAVLISTLRRISADDRDPGLDLTLCHGVLRECARRRELRACVLVYDYLNGRGLGPDDETYRILDAVHSKSVVERNTLLEGPVEPGKLNPKRRIHKVCKGAAYSASYNAACDKHLEAVTTYLDSHAELKGMHKDPLSKILSKKCGVSVKEVKYVITKLKRTKILTG